jgi:hypothetical protein
VRFSFCVCVCGMRKDLISFVSEKKWQIDAKTYGDGRKCWWGSVVLVMLSVARMCDFQFASSSWQMIRWRPAAKPSQRPAKAHERLPPSGHNVTMWSDPCLLILQKTRKKNHLILFFLLFGLEYFDFFFTNYFCLIILIKNNGFTTRWNTLLDPKITSSTNQIKWNRKKIEITREGGGNTAEVKHDKYPQLCSRRLDFDSLDLWSDERIPERTDRNFETLPLWLWTLAA